MSENERAFGRRLGKAPERSSFSQACTLLSQFLKEKRNLGNPESKDKTEIVLASVKTKNFLTNIEGQAGTSSSSQNGVVATPFFQKIVGLATEDSDKKDLRTKTTTQSVKQDLTPQMTIFYSGQVLVFNDVTAEKAGEIIALAKKGCSNISGSISNPVVVETIDLTKIPSTPPEEQHQPNVVPNKKNMPDIIIIDINKSNDEDENHIDGCVVKSSTNETVQQRPTEPANGSDLPIARRNSLHRFLEKRKDRVGANAPYQVPNRPGMGPPKPDEGSSRGGECSEKQLELKL